MVKNKQPQLSKNYQIILAILNFIAFVFSTLLVLDGMSFSILFLYILFPVLSLFYYRQILQAQKYRKLFIHVLLLNAASLAVIYNLRFSGQILEQLGVTCLGVTGLPLRCTSADTFISFQVAALLFVPLTVINIVYLLRK